MITNWSWYMSTCTCTTVNSIRRVGHEEDHQPIPVKQQTSSEIPTSEENSAYKRLLQNFVQFLNLVSNFPSYVVSHFPSFGNNLKYFLTCFEDAVGTITFG